MSTKNTGEKQYGLILPKKQTPVAPKATNIFADDDGSDEEDGTDWVKKALRAEGEKNKIKKQTKLSMQKALKEDPTIYQYDEVYDDMEQTKNQLKAPKEEIKKPKYIQNLLKAAERRKKEQEHRIERMVQKEREAEGTMFADKESFVTSAYRAKLEEFKKMEEEESRMDRLEAIGDVTKQQDMSGFYRHLYEQTLENPKPSDTVNDDDKIKELNTTSASASITSENTSKKEERVNLNRETDADALDVDHTASTKTKRSRQYRQRVVEEDESDSETETKNEVKNKSTVPLCTENKNVDVEEPSNKKQKQIEKPEPSKVDNKITTETLPSTVNPQVTPDICDSNIKVEKPAVTVNVKVLQKRDKSKIWEKRTVGPIFEAALQRYYERKAMKLSTA